MTRVILLCSFIVTMKILLKGVGFFKMSLNIAFILFANVIYKRFNLAKGARVLAFLRSFKLVLFIFYVKLRMNPSFFSSFGGKKVTVGLITVKVITLGVTITITLCCNLGNQVRLPVVINVLYNTMAGAPKLNTTGRTLDRLGCDNPRVTVKCTYTCPLKILNVVNSVVTVHCVYQVGLGGRRRSVTGRRTTGPRLAPHVVRLRMRGRTLTKGALLRIESFVKHSFIYSHVLRGNRIDVPGHSAIFRLNSRLFIIYTRSSTRTVVTFVNPGVRIS